MEELRKIDGFEDYFISNLGNVYSMKSGVKSLLKPQLNTKKNYLLIHLCGKKFSKKCLIHRLVAKAFIPNPENLPEVNHKDKNKQNNCVENLEWCTRKENLQDSYETMSSNRNYRKSYLYKDGQLVGEYDGVKRAAEAAHKLFGASESSMMKYLKWLDVEIRMDNQTGIYHYDGHSQTTTQNRGTITMFLNGNEVQKFKSWTEVVQWFAEKGFNHSESYYRHKLYKNQSAHGYTFKR